METIPLSDPIDSKQQTITKQTAAIYGSYNQEFYNMYPQPTPGYPIPQYYHHYHNHSQINYPSQSFHIHENFSSKPGSQYPGYYNYNRQQTLIQEPNDSTSFGRLMLILMIILIASMCMMSLVMWFLYGSYIPEFEVETLTVSNFSATNAALTGTNWDVNVVVRNTNQDLTVGFNNVRSAVLYKGNILGFSNVLGFGVERNEEFDLVFSVPAVDDRMVVDRVDGGGSEGGVMAALARDWENGVVVFSLRMAMSANFSSTDRGYRQESLTVSCDNLEVRSSPADREGRLIGKGVGNECLISI